MECSEQQWENVIIKKKRQLKVQFFHGLNDNIPVKIICEFTAIKVTGVVTSEQVLAWARQGEAQRTQTIIIDSLRETKDFDAIKSASGTTGKMICQTPAHTKQKCSYFGYSHPHGQCSPYGKMCGL